MILENPSAFAAFKNIRSLLPSVQHKMTHHALIKLLLDQGRDFNKHQDIQFENTLAALEKILHTKNIPFETLYRTDKPAAVAVATDVWHFAFGNGTQIDWIPDRAFSLWCAHALLGHTVTPDTSDRPLSPLEQQILQPFYTKLVQQFPQTGHQSPIQITQTPIQQPTETPAFLALKTAGEILSVRLIMTTPQTAANQSDWQEKLATHIAALSLPVEGALTQTLPLSAFLALKKGDTLTFSKPDTTPIALQTRGHTVGTGYLKTPTTGDIEIETEAS